MLFLNTSFKKHLFSDYFKFLYSQFILKKSEINDCWFPVFLLFPELRSSYEQRLRAMEGVIFLTILAMFDRKVCSPSVVVVHEGVLGVWLVSATHMALVLVLMHVWSWLVERTGYEWWQLTSKEVTVCHGWLPIHKERWHSFIE